MTRSDQMRQLLREREWNSFELAKAVSVDPACAWRLIRTELQRGNVDFVGYTPCGRYRQFTWCGDDDLITTAIRVAEYLKAHTVDDLGKALAAQLMRLSGATVKGLQA